MKNKVKCALLLALMCVAALTVCAATPEVEAGEWNFEATLDGKPIGTHRFVVSGTPQAREVSSDAAFTVRMLGITVYRYKHHAEERWQGDCLRGLKSQTDDDGKAEHVDRPIEGECMMAFAYWNPRLVTQQKLVDPQTGKVEAVKFEALPDAQIMSRGQSVAAHGWRLQTSKQRITLWYAADTGRWLALDADAKGGRKLSYRLVTASSSSSSAKASSP